MKLFLSFIFIRRGIISYNNLPTKALVRSFVILLALITMVISPAYADQSITYLGLDDLSFEKQKENTYEWKLLLNGTSWEEGTSKSVGFSTKVNTKFKFQLNNKLNIKLEGGVQWYSDNSQYTLNDYGSDSFIFADEASLNFETLEYLTFSAGSLNQGFLNAPLLISGRSFPGLKQELAIKNKKYELGLLAQQLIPTSTVFNDERTEEEELPTFLTGTLFAEYNFNNPFTKLPTAKLNAHVALSYFKFSDLPSITADRGGLYGHTGADVGIGPNSRFLYEFAGYLFEPKVSILDKNNYDLTIGGYWADNVEAIQNDRIQSMYVEAEKVISNYTVGMRVENFFKDSEASPAVYSSAHYGGNNREGMFYEASLEFNKYNFKLIAQYIDSKLISINPVQDNRQAYYLGVETLYVKF